MTDRSILAFSIEEATEGRAFFLDELSRIEARSARTPGRRSRPGGYRSADVVGAAGELVIQFATGLSLLVPTILVWLGKGKRLTLRDGTRSVELHNFSLEEAERILRDWYEPESRESDEPKAGSSGNGERAASS